jgi:hypothetical protein
MKRSKSLYFLPSPLCFNNYMHNLKYFSQYAYVHFTLWHADPLLGNDSENYTQEPFVTAPQTSIFSTNVTIG